MLRYAVAWHIPVCCNPRFVCMNVRYDQAAEFNFSNFLPPTCVLLLLFLLFCSCGQQTLQMKKFQMQNKRGETDVPEVFLRQNF
jgi:hypothetical protein